MQRDQLNEYDRALYDAFMSLAVRKSMRVIMGEIETSAIDHASRRGHKCGVGRSLPFFAMSGVSRVTHLYVCVTL
jgi:hypothetical protein